MVENEDEKTLYTVEWGHLDIEADSPAEAARIGIQALLDGSSPLVDITDAQGEFIGQMKVKIVNGIVAVEPDVTWSIP